MPTRWETIARAQAGDDYARRYAERFRALRERGDDVHGEATFVADLVAAPARVLDAGCGTGRVAVRLAELGYDVVGVDVDASMLDVARAEAPTLDWRLGDLSSFDLGPELRAAFDVVLVAGNTIPLLEAGTLAAAVARLVAHVRPGGLLVTGFGLDAAHLPGSCPVTSLVDVEDRLRVAGLEPVGRFGGWDGSALVPDGGYVVTVDRRSA